MAPYTKDDITNAIFNVTNNGLSMNKAAQKYNIPTTTINARINGVNRTKSKGQKVKQRLTPNKKHRLTKWILRQKSLGHAPGHAAVRSIAIKILRQKGDYKKLGKK